MMENDLDEETEKTLLHLVASLLLVSTAAEMETLFIVDDVSVMTVNSLVCQCLIIGVCNYKETSYCTGVL